MFAGRGKTDRYVLEECCNEKSPPRKPFQLGFVCLTSTVSLSDIIFFGSRSSSLLASGLRHSCPFSELVTCSPGREVQARIPKKSATWRRACPGPCSSLVHLSAAVCQLPFDQFFDLTILSPIAMLLGCCCYVPGLLCSPARRYRPVCPERVPQRGGSSPVSCSSTVLCFRPRRIA